jgi:hypothetical protein
VLALQLEYDGAPLRLEPKKKYLGRKMAERKRKKETGELAPDAVRCWCGLGGCEVRKGYDVIRRSPQRTFQLAWM